MNTKNFNADLAYPVAAVAALPLQPGRTVHELTGAGVTITSFKAYKRPGRIIGLTVASGGNTQTLTHTAYASATEGQLTLLGQQNLQLRPGMIAWFRQDKNGNWVQVFGVEPKLIIDDQVGTNRTIAHGMGLTPRVAAVTVVTAAGAVAVGWTLGAVDGTNITFTTANATDVVRLLLLP